MKTTPTKAERARALAAISVLIDFCEKHYGPAVEPLALLGELLDQDDDYSVGYEAKRAEQEAARIADCVISVAAKR